jgi:undecaprenyl-diphosphatase
MHALIIFLAQYLIILPPIVGLVFWLRLPTKKKKLQLIAEASVAAIIVLLLAKLGSMLFNNPRPFVAGHFTPYFPHGNDNGFPSDHTLASSFIAMIVLYKNRKIGVGLLLVALVIGLSRVIAGIHHLVDIAGSFVFSAVGVALGVYIVRQILNRRLTASKATK